MSTQTYTNPDGSVSTIDYEWAPPPAPPVTLFGDTGRGESDATGVAIADAIYGGPGEAWRQYFTGPLGMVAVTDRKVIGSFKTMPGQGSTGWLNAHNYWRLFYQHEIDAKVKKGAVTLAQWQLDMTTLAGTNIDGVGVCLTADCFVNSAKNPADYLVPGVTHLGVDFDGISSATGYHDYSKELSAVVAFAAANNLTWGVPEFGANRATNDLTGDARAAWLVHWAAQFQAAGAEYVCLWEQTSQAGSCFTTPAEVATVRAMLALGPRATA